MQIRIDDETARKALQAALWRRLSHVIGGRTTDAFQDEAWDCADAIIMRKDAAALIEAIDGWLAALTACRSDIRLVSETHLPATVEISTEAPALEDAMRGVMLGISEDESFWERDPNARQWTMALHDSLSALRDYLGLAGAVA